MAGRDITKQEVEGRTPAERQSEWMHPFFSFRKEMDRLMGDFIGGFSMQPFGRNLETFTPNIDVVDTDNEIQVSAELPGMDQKDIDVSIAREALTIRGEKKEEKEEKGKGYYRSERSFGSFSRTIPLPMDIEAEKVTASFKKGVLTVCLPKTKKVIEETKKITIKAE